MVTSAAVRTAGNGAVFQHAAKAAPRSPIELIAGDEAGCVVYLGVASTLSGASGAGEEARLVFDIGADTTELVLDSCSAIERIESFQRADDVLREGAGRTRVSQAVTAALEA